MFQNKSLISNSNLLLINTKKVNQNNINEIKKTQVYKTIYNGNQGNIIGEG